MPKKLTSKVQKLYFIIFVIALAVTIFFSSPILVEAQQPTNVQELEAEIKQLAARHAKKGEAKTDRILNLYRDNKFGLTPIKIEEIYETEFDRLKKPKYPIDEFISRLPPWFLVVVGSGLTLVVASFQEQLRKKLVQLWDWVFQRFAGNALFRNQALRRYQKSIIQQHKNLFIPFRPQRPLAMNQVYVALKVAGRDYNSSKKGIKAEIDAGQAVEEYSRLMVTGAPGSGKTMLLKYLLLSYAQGNLLLPDRPIPVLLELYRLKDPKLTQDQLIQAISKAFERYGWPKADSFVRQCLQRGQLLLLLDGLDEVKSGVRSNVANQLRDLLQTYPCRAVITCRTMVYEGSFNPPLTDQLLDVVEFTDQQIRRFLSAWEAQMSPERSLEQLLKTLRDRPRIMALARSPLLLTIIAFLYTDTPFELPHSRAEFYQESTRFLLGQWHQEHNQYKINEKQLVLRHLALYNQDNVNDDNRNRRSLDYRTVLAQIQVVLPGLNLNPESDTRLILEEIVERSGLLLKLDGGERYQLAHLTLQEYFAAEALRDKEVELLQRFRADPVAWREVVKLWCGLPNDSTELIEKVYQCDKVTAFECLADAIDIQEEVATMIIQEFEAQLEVAVTDDSIAKAFGAVASNSRSRGQEVFQFLMQTLETQGNNSKLLLRKQGAVNALSRTNHPQAANVLAQYYSTEGLDLREPLVRMGNLAVDALVELIRKGSLWSLALPDLASIATSEAALALVPFLWDKNRQKAGQVAWYLGELITQPSVEERLRRITLTTSQRQANTLDWIWSPFQSLEPTESPIPILTGRIAYLIGHIAIESIPQPLPKIDPRLSIPLCGIEMLDHTQLPRVLTDQAEFLLEQPEVTPELEQAIQTELKSILTDEKQTSWIFLLSSLSPRQQLDLLARLIKTPHLPLPEDWRFLFQNVKYNFKTGWHYRLVLLQSVAASFLALLGMTFAVSELEVSGFIGLAFLIVITFWIFLWRGIEGRWEPSTFIRFGFRGPLTFSSELRRFLQGNLVWVGPIPLTTYVPFAAIVAGTVAVASAGSVTGYGFRPWPWVVAVAVTGSIAGSGSVPVAVTGAVPVAVAWAEAVTGAWSGAVAGAWAWAWAMGFGVRIWGKKSFRQPKHFKFMAVFTFPFFCWLPITVFFSTMALSNVLPANEFSFPLAVLIELSIFSLCIALWKRGQYHDRRARNPFHGIFGLHPERNL